MAYDNDKNGMPKGLKKRVEHAEARREDWRSILQDCYEYVLPQRENWTKHQRGARKNQENTYDSTARNGVFGFANRMQSVMVPINSQWARLVAGKRVADAQKDEVNRALQEMTEVAFQYINASNMAVEIGESFLDLAVGTGAMIIEDTGDINNPLRFKAVDSTEVFLEEGPWGTVETVFRKFKVPLRNVKRQYKKLCPSRDEQAKNQPEATITVVEAVVFNPKTKKYDFYAIDWAKNFVMEKDSMEVSPWVVFRWATTTGEIYGRGPVVNALPDIITLNKVVELELSQGSWAAHGAYTFNAESDLTTENLKIVPNAKIPVPPDADLKLLQVNNSIQVSQLIANELRENIKKALFSDRLPPLERGAKSATEISIRQRELQQDIGAAFGRLQQEMINPIIKRVLYILQKNGLVQPIKLDDAQLVDIQVASPIARNNADIDNANAYLGNLAQLAELFGPDFITNAVKAETLPKWFAEKMGVDFDLLHSDEEIREKMEAQKAKQAEAEQMQQLSEGAKAANDLGLTIDPETGEPTKR